MGKIDSLIANPKNEIKPKIDFYSYNNIKDPISAALEIIIFDNKDKSIKVFDGRRIYNLSTKTIDLSETNI